MRTTRRRSRIAGYARLTGGSCIAILVQRTRERSDSRLVLRRTTLGDDRRDETSIEVPFTRSQDFKRRHHLSQLAFLQEERRIARVTALRLPGRKRLVNKY